MEADALLAALTRSADEQREAALVQARKEADAILEQARQQCAQRRKKALAALRAELEDVARDGRARAEAEAARAMLSLRETVAEDIMGQVMAEIERHVQGPAFAQTFDALLAEIAEEVRTGVRVLAPPLQVNRCRQWLAARGLAEVEVRPAPDIAGGVAIEDAERTFRVTNTLAVRYAVCESDARKTCAALLFAEES